PAPVIGLIIISVGLELGLLGTEQFLNVKNGVHSPHFGLYLLDGLVTLAFMFALSIWSQGMLRLFSAIIGLFMGWATAFFFGLIPTTSLDVIGSSSFFGWPHFEKLSYSFDIPLMIPFFISGIAAMLRCAGVVITCQRMND